MNFDYLFDNITYLGPQLGGNRGFKRRDLMRLLRIIYHRRRAEGDEMIGAAVEAKIRVQLRRLEAQQ